MSSARLLESVNALVSCRDLGELANGVAQLAQRLLEPAEAFVLLRGPDGECPSGAPSAASGLETWVAHLLGDAPGSGVVSDHGLIAGHVDASAVDVRGVVAVALPDSTAGAAAEDAAALVGALAQLTATCAAQIQRRAFADRALQDTRALIARGLHDLCTPLNSLRLGMHLLEPALTTKDPAVAQRAHRAVDRMAALVTTMADALGKENGARSVSPS